MRHIFPTLAAITLVGAAFAACAPGSQQSSGAGGHHGTTSTGAQGGGGSGVIDIDGGDGGGTCAGATTCAKQNIECGPAGDGCGGIIECGDCTAPETCGGGGVSGKCGMTVCQPKTCADLGANCGPVGDGCGGVLDCGTCTAPDACGGGGKASVCGTGSSCTPKDCASQGVNCGPFGDGCGNVIQCGTCPVGQSCGGGNIPSVCGAPPCTPKTCASAGANCGPIADGCGGVVQCGSCNQPQTCGGAGQASVCGIPSSCTGLCLKQVTCPDPAVTTTVSGTAYAPNGDPLPNVLVYVPNAPVQPFTPGVSCDNCSSGVSGSPLVSGISGIDGKFTISNMPVGTNIPLVIQIGRWRRQVTISNVASCTNTPVSASLTRLPKNKGEGDIPLMAFATGSVDALECVMRKIGVDDAEFTAPSGNGRIHLYEGLDDPGSQNGQTQGGAKATGSPNEDQLWSTQAALNKYDMVLFPCQADQTTRSAAAQQNLLNYVNAGGRVFATHFSYVWFYQNPTFSQATAWNVEQHPSPANQTGYINTTFPKGQALAQWLQLVGASTFPGQIPLQIIRHDYDFEIPPTQSWMSINDVNFGPVSVHYTFNTPLGKPADQQCGRVLFDDYHVENVTSTMSHGVIFPAECVAGPMTAQEKLLEFMIFDLGSCIAPDVPKCTPQTCAQAGAQCGPAGDGCGGLLDCGPCPMGQTCGGGGQPSVCGSPTCTPKTCQDQNIHCGPAGDGCGNLIQCGACPGGQTCGGGGMPGVCGNLTCTPKTCQQQGIQCGPAGDGCGGLLGCGSCPAGQTCGGGGQPGICGNMPCQPKTCAELGFNCGPAGDGCGGVIQCGTCQAPQTCGGGGQANVCGGSAPH